MVSKQDIFAQPENTLCIPINIFQQINYNVYGNFLLFALFIHNSSTLKFLPLNSIQHADQHYFTFIYIAFTFVVGQYYILSVVRSRIKEK